MGAWRLHQMYSFTASYFLSDSIFRRLRKFPDTDKQLQQAYKAYFLLTVKLRI